MEGMRVYISGRIGREGITPEVRAKFARAEAMLKKLGHAPVNPASEHYQEMMKTDFDIFRRPMDYRSILYYDLGRLWTCKAVYMLGDWEESPGANVEHSYALATGMTMFWEREEDARLFAEDEHTYDEFWLPLP